MSQQFYITTIPHLSNLNTNCNSRNGETMGFFDEIDYDDYEDVPIEDMLDEFGSVRTCPPTPLDGFSGGNLTSWIETCDSYTNKTTHMKFSPEKPANSTSGSKTFVLRKPKGPGVTNGLSLIIDSIKCGWHSTSLFDGIKVRSI